MKIRSYRELIKLPTFQERYQYLRLTGSVGRSTFGFDRYINQQLYTSRRWKKVRDKIIIRDNGCDLSDPDYSIADQIFIHHMNPLTKDEVLKDASEIYNPEFLICASKRTHNAIHFGIDNLITIPYTERTRYDTSPWL